MDIGTPFCTSSYYLERSLTAHFLSICLHGTSIHFRLQRLHPLVLLLRNWFSGHVESNVSLQSGLWLLYVMNHLHSYHLYMIVHTIIKNDFACLKKVNGQEKRETLGRERSVRYYARFTFIRSLKAIARPEFHCHYLSLLRGGLPPSRDNW